MNTTVQTRPNHYEVLGLSPSATSADVTRAFAQRIGGFRPHAFGDVAFVSLAYETLRDPAKRRAYDESIGVAPQVPSPPAGSVGAHFIASMSASPVEHAVSGPPRQEPQPSPELEMASFIAASLREPEEPIARVAEPPVQPKPNPVIEPLRTAEFVRPNDTEMLFDEVENEPTDWKRTLLIGGALVAVAAIPGAVLGLWSGNGETDDAAVQPSNSVTLPLAAPVATPVQPQPAAKPTPPEQPVARARQAPTRAAALPKTPPPTQPQATPAPAPAVETASSAMPLPDSTIARTIGRIGYACGSVASTTAVEGSPGVFRVTCTSGDAYQARPIRGRYHFKRIGGR